MYLRRIDWIFRKSNLGLNYVRKLDSYHNKIRGGYVLDLTLCIGISRFPSLKIRNEISISHFPNFTYFHKITLFLIHKTFFFHFRLETALRVTIHRPDYLFIRAFINIYIPFLSKTFVRKNNIENSGGALNFFIFKRFLVAKVFW